MRRIIFITTVLLVGLIALLLFSLKCGILECSYSDAVKALTASGDFPAFLIRELRLPRTLLSILSGMGFAVSGVILQKVLHNELAAPDILGISGGAGCAGLILLIYFPLFSRFLGIAAFGGAMLAAMLICLAAWSRTLSPVRLILSGVALGALFSTACGAVIFCNSDKLTGVMEFTFGGFSGKNMTTVWQTLPFFAVTLILTLFLPRKLELLSLGKDEARSLGLAVERARLLALITAALAAATAVSAAGLLGFVGLISPHIAGALLKTRRSGVLLVNSALAGAILTLGGDLLGRTVLAPRELPCGLFLSGAGALFFLILLLKNREEI